MALVGEEGPPLAAASSAEDLSEYTDADESISAPTEFLAEFLSAVMLKDYETALKYCKLILQYEPNNATAKEFYPLIVEKLEMIQQDSDSESESSEADSSSSNCSSSSGGDGEETKPTDSDATTASYSSLEEDEADQENNAIRFTRQFSSTDFTNGNTSGIYVPEKYSSDVKQRLAEAIQRKLDDNRRAIRLPLETRLDRLTSSMSATSLNPLSPDSADFSSVTPSSHMSFDMLSPESESAGVFDSLSPVQAVIGKGGHWMEKSPESEASLGFPFSSGSESPSDPQSQLTVQEVPHV